MLDKEKLIIVFYLGVSKLSKKEINESMVQFANSTQIQFDESVKTIILPDTTQSWPSVRVEVINPITLTENEYNGTVVPFVKQAEEAIKDFEQTEKPWRKWKLN